MADPKFDKNFQTFRKREWVPLPGKNPVRISASGETKGKCRAEFERKRLEAIEESGRAAADAAAPKPRKTFEAFADAWIERYVALKRNREAERIAKAYHLRIHLKPYFQKLAAERGGQPVRMDEINSEIVDRFAADLSEKSPLSRATKNPTGEPKKLSTKTVSNVLQTFRMILAWAKRYDEIGVVPEVPHMKLDDVQIDFLTFTEAGRLLAAITDPEDLALIMTAVRAGPRAGELLGLRWSDLDFVKREIRIDHQLARKGSALEPTKTRKGIRTVPMTGALRDRLQALKHLRGEFVFCDGDGRPYSRGHLRKKLARACKRAGLRTLSPHDLRHTFASHLVMRGISIAQIQEWMGHATLNMTMRYAHLAPGVGSSLIDRLEEPAAA